jgi:hypothetical protein
MTSTPTTQNHYEYKISKERIHAADSYENPLLTTDIRFTLAGGRSDHQEMIVYISPQGVPHRKDYMGKEITELYAQFVGSPIVILSNFYGEVKMPETITVNYGDILKIEGHGRFEVRQSRDNYPELILIGK